MAGRRKRHQSKGTDAGSLDDLIAQIDALSEENRMLRESNQILKRRCDYAEGSFKKMQETFFWQKTSGIRGMMGGCGSFPVSMKACTD